MNEIGGKSWCSRQTIEIRRTERRRGDDRRGKVDLRVGRKGGGKGKALKRWRKKNWRRQKGRAGRAREGKKELWRGRVKGY